MFSEVTAVNILRTHTDYRAKASSGKWPGWLLTNITIKVILLSYIDNAYDSPVLSSQDCLIFVLSCIHLLSYAYFWCKNN